MNIKIIYVHKKMASSTCRRLLLLFVVLLAASAWVVVGQKSNKVLRTNHGRMHDPGTDLHVLNFHNFRNVLDQTFYVIMLTLCVCVLMLL